MRFKLSFQITNFIFHIIVYVILYFIIYVPTEIDKTSFMVLLLKPLSSTMGSCTYEDTLTLKPMMQK